MVDLPRRLTAEALGSALLLATIIGSGIMGETLAGGNVAIALLANTIATGAMLVVLILAFGDVSGAHFNPVVTIAEAARGAFRWRDVLPFALAQVGGALAGVAIANVMFQKPAWFLSKHERSGTHLFASEIVATFGLLAVIACVGRARPKATPFAVGLYITAAYWFTSSTSFANPAVTIARAASDTFAGIRPTDVPMFVLAQCIGAGIASVLFRWLLK